MKELRLQSEDIAVEQSPRRSDMWQIGGEKADGYL